MVDLIDIKLSPSERRVLRALHRSYADFYLDGFCYASFSALSRRTHLNRKEVRRAARALRRKGLADYARGLFTEDGEVAGAGYACTKAGAALMEKGQ